MTNDGELLKRLDAFEATPKVLMNSAARIRELKELLTECEHILFIWRGAYVVGESASLKAACNAADATLTKLRSAGG